jgi:MoxR-like ATPase
MDKILTGKALLEAQTFEVDGQKVSLDAYLPDDDLVDAVNLALQLKRPLLIMGEPGCGKTRLAEAIAYELHNEKMPMHFFHWYIKSTTKAKEGLYQYDALGRLYDANTNEAKARGIENYISYGTLGKALLESQNEGKPNVLLIDEIDKADIDFPNDLLLELDQKVFYVPELAPEGKDKHEAKSEVLVIITSNQEKELPAAFLRRCLYHYIEFPKKEKLTEIVEKYVSLDKEIISKALDIFTNLREDILSESDKKPSTSELIDWVKMIDRYTKLKAEKNEEKRNDVEKRLIAELDKLDEDKIPFYQILFKTKEALNKRENEQE